MPLDDATYRPQSIVSVLVEARRLVGTSWFHGYPGNQVAPPHEYCPVTAIARQNVGFLSLPALEYVARVIGCDLNGIVPWNDDLERTLKDVLDVYDAAIELAKMDELVNAA
jgi:hypothetical protein